MNKTIFFFAAILLFASCHSETELQPVKQLINTYINDNAHDPGTYELIEITPIDTITVAQSFKCHIDLYQREIKTANDNIKRMKEFNQSFASTYSDEDFNTTRDDHDTAKAMQNGTQKLMDAIKEHLPDPLLITYYHKYRAANAVGGVALYESLVQVKGDMTEIINFTNDQNDVIRCPRFPGYYKLLERVQGITRE